MKYIFLFLCIMLLGVGLFSFPTLANSNGPLWADYIASPQKNVKKMMKRKQPKRMYLTVFHYNGAEVDLDKAEKERLLRTVQRLDKGLIKSLRFVCSSEKKHTCTQRIKKMRSFILNNILDDHFKYTVKIIHSENNVIKNNLLKIIEK